jgi:hypothetical protein
MTSIVVTLIAWILETRNKTKDLKTPYKEYPPEATHGVWSWIFISMVELPVLKGL